MFYVTWLCPFKLVVMQPAWLVQLDTTENILAIVCGLENIKKNNLKNVAHFDKLNQHEKLNKQKL